MGRTSTGCRTAGRNAAIVQRIVETIWNRGELAMADRLFAPTYVNHGGLIPDLVQGPEAVKISVVLLRTAFPEMRIAIIDLTAEGNTVDLHWAAGRDVDQVLLPGPPDGLAGGLRGTTVSTLAHGKIMESWTAWDPVNALRHLDIGPPGAQS